MIYLDQAATSFPKPQEVADAMLVALQSMGNSGRGAHEMSLSAGRMVFSARSELAELLGAKDPGRIAFTANATESLNLALFGLLKPGDHVITTAWEHNSVLRPLYRLETQGVELSVLPSNAQGSLDLTGLGGLLRLNTKAVVCTHASNVTGNLIDLAYVSDFCLRHNLLLIVDGAQTAGFLPINVRLQNIDVFCFTGHKSLYGPQGVGGIYLSPGLDLQPLKVGGSGMDSFSPIHPTRMPEALEAGTLNTPGIAGLLAGVRYIKKTGLEKIRDEEQGLTKYFYERVQGISGVTVYGDFRSFYRCPIVSLNIDGLDSSFVSQVLAEEYGIYTRAGAHCAPLIHKALSTAGRGVVRFSFSHLNTTGELDQALLALASIQRNYGRG